MEKIPVVVFGLGRIGMLYGFDKKRTQPASHIEAILDNQNFNLVGVCDPSKNYRNKFLKNYKIINIFNSTENLLDFLTEQKIIPQLFVVATPENTHFSIIQKIVKTFQNPSKKTIIFCEKPLTRDLTSSKKIKNLISNTNYHIVVNHTRRWSDIWKTAFLNLKKIGTIEHASFFYSTSPENKTIDQLRDGIHIADIINWYDIRSKILIRRIPLSYLIYDFHIWGNKGKIEILNNGETLKLYTKKPSKRFDGFFELILKNQKKFNDTPLRNTYYEFSRFFNNKNIQLSTNITDAIEALITFKKYVYEKRN